MVAPQSFRESLTVLPRCRMALPQLWRWDLHGGVEGSKVMSIEGEHEVIDVRALRGRLGMSQEAFARSFRFSVSAVREWEQGRRRPEAAARTLLCVIAHDHRAVLDALAASTQR
jgi:putative transcriptional regulator